MSFHDRRRIIVSKQMNNQQPNRHIPVNFSQNREIKGPISPLYNSRKRSIVTEWVKDSGKDLMVISFISDPIGSNFYSSRIKNLIGRLNDLDYDYLVRQYPSDREYHQNCCFKPVFIEDVMSEYGRNIIWVDGDTIIKDSFGEFCDISRDFDVGLVTYNGDISGFVASPLLVRNTENGVKLISEWAEHCTEKVETGQPELDHDAIKHSVIPKFRTSLRIRLSDSTYHSGRVIENVNSDVPNKRSIMDHMKNINPHRPFNYTNKDFIIV